jgi:hypothetical protein
MEEQTTHPYGFSGDTFAHTSRQRARVREAYAESTMATAMPGMFDDRHRGLVNLERRASTGINATDLPHERRHRADYGRRP